MGSRNGPRESGDGEGLERRIYGKAEGDGERLSGVLYRERLAQTFNSQGFVNFRNLAKISRPKKRKKREANENRDGGVKRNKFAVVEVIEDEEREGEDLRGLLGDEFKGRRWRVSTRLLLLDDSYAERCLEDMPEAVKVGSFWCLRDLKSVEVIWFLVCFSPFIMITSSHCCARLC